MREVEDVECRREEGVGCEVMVFYALPRRRVSCRPGARRELPP